MSIQCPDCGVIVDTGSNAPGTQFACDNCGRPLTVPADASPPPPPQPGQAQPEPAPEALESEVPPVFSAPPREAAQSDSAEAADMVGIDEPEPISPAVMMFDVEDEEPFVLPPDEEATFAPGRPVGGIDVDEYTAPEAGVSQAAGAGIANPSELAVPRLDSPPLTGQPYPPGYTPAIVARRPGAAGPSPAAQAPTEELTSFGPPPEAASNELPMFAPPPSNGAAPTFGPPPGHMDPSAAALPGIMPGGVPTTSEVGGLNFGALYFSWLWAAFHGLWLWTFLGFFLNCGWVNVYLLFKGNQLAWANSGNKTYEQFRASQRRWSIAALICLFIVIASYAVALITGIAAALTSGRSIPGVGEESRGVPGIELSVGELEPADEPSSDDAE